MAIGIGFIAQATDTHLTLGQELALLVMAQLTLKGATGMAGGSLVKITATLRSVAALPASGISLLIGIERLIAPGIAVCNVIGNVVATLVIARSEGRLDMVRFASAVSASSRPTRAAESLARPSAVPPPKGT